MIIKSRKGFTLIELLVYVSVMTFLTIVIMDALIGVSKLNSRSDSAAAVTRSALISLNRIDAEVRHADSASASGDTLTLAGTDNVGNPRTVEFYQSGSSLAWRENGAEQGSLTESGVTLSSLAFSTQTAASTTAVYATMTIGATSYRLTSVIRISQ